jgi:metal-responsive CopG/Arc/MetJ family transcriptional regulator
MRRATITIPDDLEADLASYLETQDAAPSLASIVETALRLYLEEKRLETRQYQPPRGPLRITLAETGSGASDVGRNHDRYLADQG